MSIPRSIAMAVMMLATASLTGAAAIEKLGEPCRAFNILASRYVKGPAGQNWLVMTSSSEATNVQLLIVDYEKNEGRSFTAPQGMGAWSLNVASGDRLIVGTYDGAAYYMVFDLKAMAFVNATLIKGEHYVWNSVFGSDGRLYGGTYPGAHLVAFDLNTGQPDDLGCPAPPNHYMRYVSALPDGRILCDVGLDKQTRVIFDPRTKKFSPVPASFANVGAGVSFEGYFVVAPSWEGQLPDTARVFKSDTLEPVDNPPFPTPPANGGKWAVILKASTPQALLYQQGKTIWRCRAGSKTLEKVYEGELRAGIAGQTPDGKLLCVRGQEYAVVTPGDTDIKFKPIPCDKAPRPSHFLRVDPQGRVWGGPQFGQTVFYFDPKTGKTVNTSVVCNAGGEVYDAAFLNGKTYTVSYIGGDLVEFDPAQPWDQWNNKNPRSIHHMADRGYIRPLGGIQLGDDGKLYSSWSAKYGTYGGAIAITDPADGKTELIENPLGKQSVSAFALDNEYIYVGTDLSGNGLLNQKNAIPNFGMIDRKTHKVVFQHALNGASGVEHILYDPATRRVVLSVDRKILFFDPSKRQFSETPGKETPDKETPGSKTPALSGGSLISLGDGNAYYASGKQVLQLDIAGGGTHVVAELADSIDKLAIAADGTIYATCGPTFYRIKR